MDPWGGSYMMERLTEEMHNKAAAIVEEIEEMGGMSKAIESGVPSLRLFTILEKWTARSISSCCITKKIACTLESKKQQPRNR